MSSILLSCKTFFAREKPRRDWDLRDVFFRVPENPRQLLDSEQPQLVAFSRSVNNPLGRGARDSQYIQEPRLVRASEVGVQDRCKIQVPGTNR
jgi:hypothetical protein